jgi:hypothetical protein
VAVRRGARLRLFAIPITGHGAIARRDGSLGIVGRGQIKSSNGQLGGLVLANIAIALHLVSLVWLLIPIGPLLQTLLAP